MGSVEGIVSICCHRGYFGVCCIGADGPAVGGGVPVIRPAVYPLYENRWSVERGMLLLPYSNGLKAVWN